MNAILLGFIGSLLAGSMTTVGAIPVLLGRSVSQLTTDVLLSFAAGVMLAASFFSLLVPAIGIASETHGAGFVPASIVVAGVALGVAGILYLDKRLPHEHFINGLEGEHRGDLDRVWLFVIAITLHNMPEGMAVGVGFGAGDVGAGVKLAFGIGLQNAPEGLAVAVALLSCGYSRGQSFLIAAATGAVEPAAGLVSAIAVSFSQFLLPWGMSLAAGAMIYVISHEIIPETHRHENKRAVTVALTVGLVLMMFLDVAFG